VAVRIERIGLMIHISLLDAGADIMNEVSQAMKRGCLFALSIGYQLSNTLYILHGEPEGAVCACSDVNSKFLIITASCYR